MDKATLNRMFSHITAVSFAVTYWDKTTSRYGPEVPAFAITFKKKPPILDLSRAPSLALGEGYMRGDIELTGDCRAMVIALEKLEESGWNGPNGSRVSRALTDVMSVVRSLKRQKEDIAVHYDLGNDFFSLWLDQATSSYSCAYFKHPEDGLSTAQQQKIDLVLKKMHLRPGMRLLDIGCGWGSLSIRAAMGHGAKVLALTLSEEQFTAVRQRFTEAGLDDTAEVRLGNYLELKGNGQFDRVVSVGMFEHADKAHHAHYFEKVRELLKPGGLSLLHTLTKPKPSGTDPWVQKYIFPGGYIPTLAEVVSPLPEHGFHLLHVESLRRHYVRTLRLWHDNLTRRDVLNRVRARFGEPFCRMWSLYLQMSAASLATGSLDVHQFVFTRGINDELPMTLDAVYAPDVHCPVSSSPRNSLRTAPIDRDPAPGGLDAEGNLSRTFCCCSPAQHVANLKKVEETFLKAPFTFPRR